MNNWYVRLKTDNYLDAVCCDGLDGFYKAINCDTIQIVRSLNKSPFVADVMCILDDNGKLFNKPLNVPATIFYCPPFVDGMPFDFVVGDVLLGVLNDAGDDVCGFPSEDDALDFGVGLMRVIGADVTYKR